MNRTNLFRVLLLAFICIAGTHAAHAQLFTPGDVVVTIYGSLTSNTLADGAATPITLQEYSITTSTSVSLVLNDQLASTGAGSQVGIQGEYGSSSEGTLQLSGNGQYLTIGGYDGNAANQNIQAADNTANGTSYPIGTPWGPNGSSIALAQSSDTDVPRVAATIDAFGNLDTSTIYTGPYNTNNPRAVYSPDGVNFLLSGQGSGTKVGSTYTDEGGLFTTTKGNNTSTGGATPTAIYTAVSTRDVIQYGGNTYYSADQNSKKGVQTGIFEYTGTPSTLQSGSGIQLFNASATIYSGGSMTPSGTGTSVNLSPQDFTFANSTTMYVADTGDPKAGGDGDGGIQKWSLVGGVWTLDYTLRPTSLLAITAATTAADGQTGFSQISLQVVGNNVDIFGVTYTAGDADPNGLYGVVDSLSNLSASVGSTEAVTELEAAPGIAGAGGADYNFKGVSFAPQAAAVPEPSTWALGIAGLGVLFAAGRNRNRARA